MKKIAVPFAFALTTLVAGCSTLDLQGRTADEHVDVRRDQAVQDFAEASATPTVRKYDRAYLNLRPVPTAKVRGPLSVRAANAAFGPLLMETARAHGYSVLFAQSVDVNKRISIDLNGSLVEEGLRTIAFLAGYVAVIDKVDRTVTVAETATFTYKLPHHLLQPVQANYTVGGNPVNNQTPSTGSGGRGNSGGSDMSAEFVVTGQSGIDPAALRVLITNMAGPNADVMVSDVGLISVRANVQAQRRIHDFLKSYVMDAMSQVEIEASIVEVTLNDEFQLGIDWSRLTDDWSQRFDVSSALGDLTASPSLTVAFTSKSIDALVNALRQVTDAKVVSNPRILAINNSPATFFDGTQMPYLGSLTSTPSSTGSDTVSQLSGSASYAVDGISFSVQPSIIDENRVQITLVPVLSSVLSFETFSLGDSGELTAPRQANKQSFMTVVAESGKTLILGGIRYTVDQRTETPAPILLGNHGRTKLVKEIVILMRATVLPASPYDPLIGESI